MQRTPLDLIDEALATHGDHAGISFSGAEDVVLIEYARQTGRRFRVFSLDTGRLHPETYRYLAEVDRGAAPLDSGALEAVREVVLDSLDALLVPAPEAH